MTTTPDLTHYFAIHRQMRIDTTRLVAALERATADDRTHQQPLIRWARGFAHELETHHTVEDAIFFPTLVERSPSVADVLDGLGDDHRALDTHIERIGPTVAAIAGPLDTFAPARDAAVELATDLRDLLHPHLDIEDADVLPRFIRCFDAAEYEDLFQQAAASQPKKGLGFAVPWNVLALEPADRPALLASAGLPLRLVYRATHRRYRRLVADAFGDVVVAS